MSTHDFDTDAEYRQQLLKELIEIVGELGWQVAIPKTDDEDDEVPGLVIGTEAYVNRAVSAMEDYDEQSH